jgi:hypothetical protein
VPAADIGQQIRQQVAAGFRPLDQVMMRVDDRQSGLDNLLTAAVKPLRPDRQMHTWRGGRCCAEHRDSPLLTAMSQVSVSHFDPQQLRLDTE